MRFVKAAATVVMMCLSGRPVLAAPTRIAVADFDYTDTSGEMRDQRALHAGLLKGFQTDIMDKLAKSGRFTAQPLGCSTAPCSVANLDEGQIAKAARAQNANYVVFGGVQKMSTLIQWGQVIVMDAATGKAVMSRTVTFRGDSLDAWHHAADYVSGLLLDGIPK